MMIIVALTVVAGGTFAIYKLLMWSKTTGNKFGNVCALLIALVMLFGVKGMLKVDKPQAPKPTARTSSETVSSILNQPAKETRSVPSTAVETRSVVTGNTQVKNRIKNYLASMPGAVIVTVRGDDNSVIVDCDFDFGTADKGLAADFAQDLIYRIMADNSDVQFSWLSINCMNGKSPVGMMVQYENGRFTHLP